MSEQKTKFCKKCELDLSLDEFHKNSRRGRLGRRAYCKTCQGKMNKEHTSHPEVKARRAALARAELLRRKLEVLNHYCGGEPKCQGCGFSDLRTLTVDHVNDDGSKHRKELNGKLIYRWLIRNGFPQGFQVLCMNCQFIKRQDAIDRKTGGNYLALAHESRLPRLTTNDKLDPNIVRQIRELDGTMSYAEIGRKFNISRCHARLVAKGEIWQNVE